MKIKKFIVIALLIILLFSLSGCYDERGIEDLAYATALGLDIEEEGISLTFQFSIPSSGESGSESSNQSTKTQNITVKCSSINSGITLVNSYISKEVNLSHCKAIIMSEKLAESGISEYLDTLSTLIEIRPDCNIIISKCTAKDFIENAKPFAEALSARYYEVSLKSSDYTGVTTATKLTNFSSDIKSTYTQGFAILGGISTNMNSSNSQSSIATQTNKKTNSDMEYKAGELPIENSNKAETFGTAVFYNDRLVGELNGLETICHLIVTNKLDTCIISIPSPFNLNSTVDLHITRVQNTDIDLEIVNGTPLIYVNVFLEGFGVSLDENTNYNSLESITILNNYAEEYIKNQIENYLYKTSKEFNSDIASFGKYALKKYSTWDKWIYSNWLKNYKYSFFAVTVEANIKTGYEYNKSP